VFKYSYLPEQGHSLLLIKDILFVKFISWEPFVKIISNIFILLGVLVNEILSFGYFFLFKMYICDIMS